MCCLFSTSTPGATVSQNNTYVQNPGFPNPYASSASASGAITYRVEKASEDVCQLRMDLESFTLRATGQTSDYDVTAVPNEIAECLDTFDIQVRNT